MYQIIDSRTQQIVGTFQSYIRASRKRDKLDNEYGGYRYQVRKVA